MRWRKRAAQSAVVERCDDGSELPLAELEAEIERLSAANRVERDGARERRLLSLRHFAGIRHLDPRAAAPAFAAATTGGLPEGEPLPELRPHELTAGVLRAGLLRDGCVLVRGLIDPDTALALAAGIERAYEERARRASGGDPGDYYDEFVPHPRFGDVQGRWWIEEGGGLLAADSPRLHFEMVEQFAIAGLRELVSDYLGEPALISVHKTTLRRADPAIAGAWHQDGYFMGEVRSLNLWLSLSRCGEVAPGLDILPRRLDHYLASAADDSPLDYTITQERVEEEAGDTPLLRPIFEPGDALFFDEWFLHQTASDPAMPNPRYAIENWFFGGSGFPEEYAPIAV